MVEGSDQDTAGRRSRKGKRERFLEMAEKRTNAVLQRLQVLGNCANRQSYDYTPEDVEKIFDAIDRQLALVKARFQEKQRVTFKL